MNRSPHTMQTLASGAIVDVKAAEQVGPYVLRVSFTDGATQQIDFRRFLERAQHPNIRAYLDPARFANFVVRNGDLMWGDHDLIFPVADLYENRIS